MGWKGRAVGGVVVVGLVAAIAVAVDRGVGPLTGSETCTASVGGHEVDLSLEQAENASLIAAVGVRRGLPARAISIALATAYQESKIENIDYGDRDSLGLFQQRPSQDWGTEDEVMDPYYATNAFYDALEKIDGYEDMRITEAAQLVQRSGFPEAYEAHAEDARALASALSGHSRDGQFHCVLTDEPAQQLEDPSDADLNDAGLVPRAADVRRDLEQAFGSLPLGGFAPQGVSTGHQEGSSHYEGRAIDAFFRPVDADNRRKGWAVAYYLVAQADRLAVETVIFDDMIWTHRRSDEGWRDYDPGDVKGESKETVAILEHRDHVHVDVFR